MNIVLINQFYPPDGAPTGRMLETVATALCEAGHQVTVLCSAGGYNPDETTGEGHWTHLNLKVIRVPAPPGNRGSLLGKATGFANFYVRAAMTLMMSREKVDRVVALTTPPYLSVLTRFSTRWRGADHVHWAMDLYPDVMVAHGMLGERGPATQLLKSMARWGWGGKRCRAVISLGPDMSGRIATYLNGSEKVREVPLWATAQGSGVEEAEISARRERAGWKEDELVLLYSGNMGLGHSFGEFLEAASRQPEGVRFVFAGEGKRKPEIEGFLAEHRNLALELTDYVPVTELAAHLLAADVHLASMAPGWEGTMVPSKVQGSLSIGRPIIFVGHASSSPATWIRESGGGWAVNPGDVDGLMAAIEEARDPSERQRRGEAAKEYAAQHFDRKINAARLAEIIAG